MRRLFGKSGKQSSDGGTAEDLDPESVGPHVLYDGTGDPSGGVDIVFVHGLRGSAYRTWSKGDICWPRDLLKDDISRARVITWGYDSDVARFFSYASKESIFGHADTLLEDLARLRQDITRPIIFVAHSLGGLVVKAALIKSASFKSHNRHLRRADIYASTSGVAFFGTPHRGSSKEGYGEILAGIAKFCLRQPNKSLLQTLKKDSPILEDQRDTWTTISNNMPVICVWEEIPTAIGMIVPEASAAYDGFNVQRASINANHSDMVKFEKREDLMYKRTVGLLQTLEKESLAAEEDRMKRQLQLLSYAEIQAREFGIDNAHASTFQWVASHNTIVTEADPLKFATWIDSHHHGLFVSGKAASGKSTLIKYLRDTHILSIRRSQWASNPSSLVLATFFFHERGTNLQKSREGMLRSLIHQILRQVPMRLFDGNSDLEWHSLTNILSKAIEGLSVRDKRLFLFLDGLDEFRMLDKTNEYTEEQKDLMYDGVDNDAAWGASTWIVDGYREISTFVLELCSKENVKVCFSCRELSVFEGKFRCMPRLQVQRYTQRDIYDYSHRRLSMEVPHLPHINKFAVAITDKASGVFLWVKLVVNKLIDGHDNGDNPKELWDTLEQLPDRLGGKNGLYMSMLRRVRKDHRAESAKLFRLVTYVQDPLHLLHLSFTAESLTEIRTNGHASCIANDTTEPSGFSALCETRLRRLKSRCGGLLEADPFVNFMHQTAREFMQRTYARNLLLDAELEFTDVNLSSALIEGSIAFVEVVRRLAPTDILWKNPKAALLSTTNILDHIKALDEFCIDAEAYVSLVDRMNGAKTALYHVFRHDHPKLPLTARKSHRRPWFTVLRAEDGHPRRIDPNDFMSLAARRDLDKYIDFKLGLQPPSGRLREALRLWEYCLRFGKDHSGRENKTESHKTRDLCRVSESINILIADAAQSGKNGTIKAMDILLPAWPRALSIGCNCFRDTESGYGKDWLQLILLMLKTGVSVSTPLRISFESRGTGITLSSSEVLLGILEMSKRRSDYDIELNDLEVEISEWLPKNLTSPPMLKDRGLPKHMEITVV